MHSLGQRIKTLRIENKMTQEELGTKVGLHSSNIGRIENGKVYPTSDVLEKMSDCFNVSLDYIIKGKKLLISCL